MRRFPCLGVVAAFAVAGCRHITVYEDPSDGPASSSSSSSGAGAPTSCSELVWDRDEPLALDPLYGVQSNRAFVEGADGVRLVSLELHPDGSSTIVSTQVADPWGGGFTIAARRDRGSITSGTLKVVPRADGSAFVFTVLHDYVHLDESVTHRVELPAGDGGATVEQPLEATFSVLSFASGRAVLARLETLKEGGYGYPWQQRLVFPDAETNEKLFERDGQLFEQAYVDSSVWNVGRGAYLQLLESEDYDASFREYPRNWLVVDEGLLEADLSAFHAFGRTASGSVAIDWEDQVVAISDEGVAGEIALELPVAEGYREIRIVPWKDEHAIVRQLAAEGEEEAALEVFARADDGAGIVSPPLPSRRQREAVEVLLGPDGRSMLVAYETWPADKGVRLARLVCR